MPTSGRRRSIFRATGLSGPSVPKSNDLAVARGEVLGILGLEGAGTFEFSETLVGLLPHTTGTLEVNGQVLTSWSPGKLSALGGPFLHSNRKEAGVYPNLDVTENAPLLKKLSRRGFLNQVALKDIVLQSIKRFSIKARPRGQLIRNLSGGNQQKLMFSLALDEVPVCFIVNEPARGVDVGSKSEIHQLIRNLVAEGGGALLISSELPELIALATSIIVMRDGCLVKRLDATDVTEENVMTYAVGGKIDE